MDTRRCPACGEDKPLELFHIKKRYADRVIYSSYCIPCGREYRRNHYRQNKDYYLRKEAERKRRILAMLREAKTRPCADCGILFAWWQMDFDHVKGTKRFGLGGRVPGNCSIRKIEAEMAKCEVVCSTCHRNRTYFRWLAKRSASKGQNDLPTPFFPFSVIAGNVRIDCLHYGGGPSDFSAS